MVPKLKEFSVCKGQRDSTMQESVNHALSQAPVSPIACFTVNSLDSREWPRCHLQLLPWSDGGDARRRLLPRPPASFGSRWFSQQKVQPWLSFKLLWASRQHHHRCFALLLVRISHLNNPNEVCAHQGCEDDVKSVLHTWPTTRATGGQRSWQE